MEKQTLHFNETLIDGITYAVMNFFQLVGCLILYLLTIWMDSLCEYRNDYCHVVSSGKNGQGRSHISHSYF